VTKERCDGYLSPAEMKFLFSVAVKKKAAVRKKK